jgi:hypothetical protein
LRWILRAADRVADAAEAGAAAAIFPRPTLLLPLPVVPARLSLLELAAVPARGPPSPICP